MKVITIGRSNDNNIVVNDPTVGRHHVQIILHDDGRIGIVDLSSKNGTYVNGKRIVKEVPLRRGDVVRIGMTILPWERYFGRKSVPRKSNDNTLAIVLGSIGGALMLLIAVLFFLRSHKTTDLPDPFQFEGVYPPVVEIEITADNGKSYTIEAIEGHVCVWFRDGTSFQTIETSIKQLGGKIVAQIPRNGYFLVEVPKNEVRSFLLRIKATQNVRNAYPNMVYCPNIAYDYVLDNYYPDDRYMAYDTIPHGEIVEFALTEYGNKSPLKSFNIGTNNGRNLCNDSSLISSDGSVCVNSEVFALDSISQLPNDGPIVINMSYGTPLPKRKDQKDNEKYYWKDATDNEKSTYKYWYAQMLKGKINHLNPLLDKNLDFIVVVSAGNEGVKEYDEAILSYLRSSEGLEPYEREIVDKHFIFVTAGEERRVEWFKNEHEKYKQKYEQILQSGRSDIDTTKYRKYVEYLYNESIAYGRYSNEVSAGHYDPWATKVDISDFEHKGWKRRGTSFSAPRASRILSSIINETNLSGADVLKLAREVTRRDGELTHDALLKAAKKYAESLRSNQESSQPPKQTPQPTPRPTPRPFPNPSPNPPVVGESETPSYSYRAKSAEDAVRKMNLALIDHDYSTVRALTTDDLYEEIMMEHYAGMDKLDDTAKRKARAALQNMPAQTIKTGQNTVVVRFKANGGQVDYYVRYEDGWKCFDYAIGGVHVPRSMRHR